MILRIKQSLNSQRGAMFSLDARIVLMIAGILSTIAGYQTIAKIDENRYQFTQEALNVLENATKQYYLDRGSLPNDIDADLIQLGYISNPEFTADGWNNAFSLNSQTFQTTIRNVPVSINHISIHSGGRDGTSDTADATTEAEWQAWIPADDDLGFSFNTSAYISPKIDDMLTKLDVVQKALISFSQDLVAKTRIDCSWTSAEIIAAGASLAGLAAPTTLNAITYPTGQHAVCDLNNDGIIEPEEFLQLNYYPQVQAEASASYRASRAVLNSAVPDNSFIVTDIDDLLTVLELPASYKNTDIGMTLCYDSNIGDKTQPPYQAGVWYTETCTLGTY